jgi:spore germination protein
MRHNLVVRARNLLFLLIYLTALGVAAFLIVQTLRLAQQRPDLAVLALPPTATSVPTAMPEPSAPALVVLPTAMPVQAPPAPAATPETLPGYHPKTGRYIAVWMPPIFQGDVVRSFEANKDIIDEISPFWYTADGSGRLYGNRNDDLVRLAHEHNILIIPTVHNVTHNSSSIVSVLVNPQLRARHIQNIVDEVLARNYDGIDIDYESLDASLRDAYSIFIRDLADALHAHGKLLTVAVHAKDSPYGGLGGFQDWAEIGKYVDRMRIMTYDYHWRGSGPGPVAPLYWVQSVAEYARSVVDPAKVVIGVPFYGYDWPTSGNARALPWRDIEDLINEQDLTVNLRQRDNRGRVDESYFIYRSAGGPRTVWFMTDAGLQSKLETVQELDLAGIAIWQLGYEKPEYWQIIRTKLLEDPALIQRAINPLLPQH